MHGGKGVVVLWAACAVWCCWAPVACQTQQVGRVETVRDILLTQSDGAYDEELPATEPGDGDWYYRKDDKAESQEVDESEAGDKDGKATSDNDDDTDDYYEDDYFGKGREEEEQSLQAQYQDPGLTVLEEPKTDGEPEPKDVEVAALEKATVKTKAPNKPTNMVLFYTWLILVVLIAVVTISTCKSRIVSLFNRGKKAASHQRQPQPEEGKRLLEHEFV